MLSHVDLLRGGLWLSWHSISILLRTGWHFQRARLSHIPGSWQVRKKNFSAENLQSVGAANAICTTKDFQLSCRRGLTTELLKRVCEYCKRELHFSVAGIVSLSFSKRSSACHFFHIRHAYFIFVCSLLDDDYQIFPKINFQFFSRFCCLKWNMSPYSVIVTLEKMYRPAHMNLSSFCRS